MTNELFEEPSEKIIYIIASRSKQIVESFFADYTNESDGKSEEEQMIEATALLHAVSSITAMAIVSISVEGHYRDSLLKYNKANVLAYIKAFGKRKNDEYIAEAQE